MRKLNIIKLCIVLQLILVLAGCSGSGNSNSSTISGIAAAGSILTGTVYLKDSSIPAKELSMPIAADGSYSFNLNGLTAPFILKAAGTANGTISILYSFASASGITNINPLTNLAVGLANGSDNLQSLYNSQDPVKMNAIVTALPSATSNIQTVLQPTLAKFGVTTINFISDSYNANHQGIDLFLDMVDIRFSSGFVYITDKQTNNSINIPLNDFKTNSVDIITSQIPSVGSVIVTPKLAVVAPNSALNFSAFVIGSASPQVTWSVVENNGGTITNNGVYIAPSTLGTYHVTATNIEDPTKSVTVEVQVNRDNVLTMVSSGAGAYSVMADNLTEVAGIEFIFTYDTMLLANPQVTFGELTNGAMTAKNTSVPGTVKWALISSNPISGSGTLATISFDLLSASPGRILSMSAKLINVRGQIVGNTVLIAPSSGAIL